MSPVQAAYLGMCACSASCAAVSAVLLLVTPHEGDRNAAWLWAVVYAVSSLLADLFFWGAF